MREFATVAIFFGMLYAAVVAMQSRPRPAFSVAPAVSRDSAADTPIAPDAATIGSGASYSPESAIEKGGDLSPASSQVEHDAQAPAGAPESPPAGAFNNQPLTTLAVAHVVNPAPAQPPAPAYVPVSAPVAQRAAPYTYRPTWGYYYQQSACGPGGCSPGVFRGRWRGR